MNVRPFRRCQTVAQTNTSKLLPPLHTSSNPPFKMSNPLWGLGHLAPFSALTTECGYDRDPVEPCRPRRPHVISKSLDDIFWSWQCIQKNRARHPTLTMFSFTPSVPLHSKYPSAALRPWTLPGRKETSLPVDHLCIQLSDSHASSSISANDSRPK